MEVLDRKIGEFHPPLHCGAQLPLVACADRDTVTYHVVSQFTVTDGDGL